MKTGIHPQYKDFEIIFSNKEIFNTKSTHPLGKMLVDTDYRTHPAWNKDIGNVVNQSNKNVSDFNKKFAGLSFQTAKK